jgi:3-hydroxyisobutyrate dehydrogenase
VSLGPAAFLGLGAIGAPMAARLARGARLTVWNRTRVPAEAFAKAHGVRSAETRQPPARCSLTAPRAILPARGGSPRVSPSGASPYADAPVSGGTNGAEAGTLTIMVGADETSSPWARVSPPW